jgi:hypothetical protein
MSTVVDRLITRFMADEGDYVRGTRLVVGATGMVTQAATSMGAKVGTAIAAATGAMAAASVGAVGFAVHQAAKMDILQRQLTVITDSAERAAQVVKFAQDLAGPSAFFDTQQLADAARILESMRLSTEKYLPVASTMASLFGQDAQSLNEFSMALGRLKSGNFGESFERFREFGISSQDLEAEGLSFKSGQFQLFDGESTAQAADRALQAVVNIVQGRFGELDAMMQDSPMAKFTSILDALGRMSVRVGTVILNALEGPLTEIGTAIANLAASPWPDIIGRKLTGAFNINGAVEPFKEAIASMLAGLNQVPEMASAIGSKLAEAWNIAREALAVYLSFQAGMLAAETVRGIQAAVTAIQALGAATKASAIAMAILSGLAKNWASIAAGLLAGAGVYAFLTNTIDNGLNLDPFVPGFDQQKFEMERDAIKNAMSPSPEGPSIESAIEEAINAIQGGAGGAPGPAGQPGGAPGPVEGELSAQTRLLGAIESNPRPEFGRAEAFGGGRLGALGVTPEELSRIGSRRSGSRFAEQLSSLIGNEMARQVDQRVSDMMRYGALRTR